MKKSSIKSNNNNSASSKRPHPSTSKNTEKTGLHGFFIERSLEKKLVRQEKSRESLNNLDLNVSRVGSIQFVEWSRFHRIYRSGQLVILSKMSNDTGENHLTFVIKAGESLPPSLVQDGTLDIQFMKDWNEKPDIIKKLLNPSGAMPRSASNYSRYVVLAFTDTGFWRLWDLHLIRSSTNSAARDSVRPFKLSNSTAAVKPIEDSNRVDVPHILIEKSPVKETSHGSDAPMSSLNSDSIQPLKTKESNIPENISTRRSVLGILELTYGNFVINFPLPSLIVLAIEDEEPVLKVTFEAANGQYNYLCPAKFTRSYPLNQPGDIYCLVAVKALPKDGVEIPGSGSFLKRAEITKVLSKAFDEKKAIIFNLKALGKDFSMIPNCRIHASYQMPHHVIIGPIRGRSQVSSPFMIALRDENATSVLD